MRLAGKGCLPLLGLLGGMVLWYQRRQVTREVNRFRGQLNEWRQDVKNLH